MKEVIITLVTLFFVSCNVTNDSSNSLVNFQSSQHSYALGDSVTVVLQNDSKQSILYGNPFTVEQKIQGEWKNIGPSVTFTLIGYNLEPGDKTKYRFALTDSSDLFPNHLFSEGQYRVITEVEVQGENRTLISNSFDVSAMIQQNN